MLREVLLAAVVLVVVGAAGLWVAVRQIQGPEIPQGATDMQFVPVPVDWSHEADLDASLPFFALAAVDLDNDETDELFAGGGRGQADAVPGGTSPKRRVCGASTTPSPRRFWTSTTITAAIW